MAEKKDVQKLRHPIAPFFSPQSKVIILGSFPSPKSRETGFYYGHPQNRFWKVMASLFFEKTPGTIPEKKAMLERHGIALWDVIKECNISGASDSSIKSAMPNDIAYLAACTDAKAVFLTGKTAFSLYTRYCSDTVNLPYFALPSTSAANAAFSCERLTECYRVILKYLDLQ